MVWKLKWAEPCNQTGKGNVLASSLSVERNSYQQHSTSSVVDEIKENVLYFFVQQRWPILFCCPPHVLSFLLYPQFLCRAPTELNLAQLTVNRVFSISFCRFLGCIVKKEFTRKRDWKRSYLKVPLESVPQILHAIVIKHQIGLSKRMLQWPNRTFFNVTECES